MHAVVRAHPSHHLLGGPEAMNMCAWHTLLHIRLSMAVLILQQVEAAVMYPTSLALLLACRDRSSYFICRDWYLSREEVEGKQRHERIINGWSFSMPPLPMHLPCPLMVLIQHAKLLLQ